MSKKIVKDEFVKSDKLKHFGFKIYETVELGEKPKKLEKVADMEYTPGEIDMEVGSFDEEIEMGRAVIVQDKGVKTEKFDPKSFENSKPVNEKLPEPEPEPEEEPEPEPELPLITEEDVNLAAEEARKAGYADGLENGRKQGEKEAEKKYQAEKTDYMAGLEKAYGDVLEQVKVFQQAVDQLDESLPDIIVSMVKDIVGEERKINDGIVASVAQKSLAHLRELEKVVFLVHPDDTAEMKKSFPDYETRADNSVEKGSLKVSTNIGEMNFSIDRMLREFVDRIHEEFSPTEEG